VIDSGRSRNSNIRIRILLCCLSAAIFGAFAASVSAVTLTILHTSDLHGHVDPRDEIADRDYGEGLARVATSVASARAEGRPTLLLDSGDTIQGTPAQALVFKQAGGKADDPTVRAMNRLGYAAMAVGNHEFDFGRPQLERSRSQARFPWLSANIVENGKPVFVPFVILTVQGIRVGILGLTTKNVASWEPPAHVAGLQFQDTVEAARRYVPLLRGRERCDLVIVLTHQGFERDPASGEDRGGSEENQAYAIATDVPGIDLLLTGHTHTVIDPRRLGTAWISQPGRFGNTLTRFDVTLAKKGGHWRVEEISGRNLSMKDVPPAPEIVALVSPEHEAAMKALSEPVGTLDSPVASADARVADTGILDWLHSVQRREGKADVSFASMLPGNLAPWPAGPLTVRQVWAFYPYENALVTVRATGRQIREALEQAGRCISGLGEQDGRFVWKRNPAIWGYNCDTADGVEYAIDPTRPEGKRVLFVRRAGQPLGEEDTLTVALNSYRASGGGGYAVWRGCPRVSASERNLRDLLLEDARRTKSLHLEANRNWFLAPSLPEGRFVGN
jgi:2',3'-cyclic-nucleotide 2'-phosphodiesterase (5'-nucleotidase family)